MRNIIKNFFYVIVLLGTCCFADAEIKMPKIFSDNMILQQNMTVKIWGVATPNATIEIDFAGQKQKTKASQNGNWVILLSKMSAGKTPRDMFIYENGIQGKVIKNILVGEVWIAGGQSNMEFGLQASSDGKDAIKRANYPTMRYFSQFAYNTDNSHIPLKDSVKGKWHVISEENAKVCSAVAFYFAEKLMKDLDVPVGILYTSRGATSMIAWIPESYLESLEYTKKRNAEFKEALASYDYKKALGKHNKKMADAKAEDAKREIEGKPKIKRAWNFHIAPKKNTPWDIGTTPSFMYNTMIAPIAGFTVRGIIWYQGEGDSSNKDSLSNFKEQMKLVVDSWRNAFENNKLPFYIVQLTSLRYSKTWPDVRWAQLKSRDVIENFGVVNIIDRGEFNDIHPKYKTEVGVRLGNLALHEVYNKGNIYPYPPEFKSAKYIENNVTIEFNTYGRRLVTKGKPRGFQILIGEKWIDAKPELKNSTVTIKSPQGTKIKGVRYMWKGWAADDIWIYNEDELPAFSFIDKIK